MRPAVADDAARPAGREVRRFGAGERGAPGALRLWCVPVPRLPAVFGEAATANGSFLHGGAGTRMSSTPYSVFLNSIVINFLNRILILNPRLIEKTAEGEGMFERKFGCMERANVP